MSATHPTGYSIDATTFIKASLRLEAATKQLHFPAIHVLPVMSLAETSGSNRNMTFLKLAYAILLSHGHPTPVRMKI
ncbi:MAG: hypothetical protein OXI44_07845 [Bacteroidota bacterium]|nr:hypothetical protein [Bacteroidota bacterium]